MRALVFAIALLICMPGHAAIKRSNAARHAFVKMHACPSTGQYRLPCHGYVIDHIKPLCAGGPDKPSNMQWQNLADSRKKDKTEWRECRLLRANGK
jgi:hypothetical protein